MNTQVNWIIDNHNPHVVDKCLMIVPLIWNDEGVKLFKKLLVPINNVF